MVSQNNAIQTQNPTHKKALQTGPIFDTIQFSAKIIVILQIIPQEVRKWIKIPSISGFLGELIKIALINLWRQSSETHTRS
jgi:hypothetical protein